METDYIVIQHVHICFKWGQKNYHSLSVIQHHLQGVYVRLVDEFSVADFIM